MINSNGKPFVSAVEVRPVKAHVISISARGKRILKKNGVNGFRIPAFGPGENLYGAALGT